ncbi:MAG: helicase-related protein [Halobacteriales archaeon]|nr:helicase-related protein [Halobacteriales archaeon]
MTSAHTYTGVHGMHVSWVLRRLQRVINHYGSDPQLVCSTATIGNPKEHSEALTGEDVTVIDSDGSPSGQRDIAFWLPQLEEDDKNPEVQGADASMPDVRKRAGIEAASVTAHLGLNDVQTLSFVKSRQGTEIAAKQAVDAVSEHPRPKRIDVKPYHAGLSKKKRQAVENNLKSGQLDAVFTTSALELGIDIGGVDATVLTGYPGTRQSFWQQVGRAGRGTTDALSVFIPQADAIDQYILDDPDYLLGDNIEDAVIDISNNPVYARHVLCAANELALTAEDAEWFGPRDRLERAVDVWNDAGKLIGDLERGAQYAGPPRPANTGLYVRDDGYPVRRPVRRRGDRYGTGAERTGVPGLPPGALRRCTTVPSTR